MHDVYVDPFIPVFAMYRGMINSSSLGMIWESRGKMTLRCVYCFLMFAAYLMVYVVYMLCIYCANS